MNKIDLIERHEYGSSRLGIVNETLDMSTSSAVDLDGYVLSEHFLNKKRYELSNHLGNVLSTISDYKKPNDVNADALVDFYNAQVISSQDYYPFGAPMKERTFSSAGYRYGFNGKENDNEVKGNGNQQDYGMRIYDPRLARFLSVDPLTREYPELTPYQFAGNTPIQAIDLDGLEPAYVNGMNYIWDGFGQIPAAISKWFDSFTFGNKEEVKHETSKTKITPYITNKEFTYASTTTEVSTNFSDNLSYIKYNNTNKGNPNTILKVKNETEVGMESETSITVNGGFKATYSKKTSTTGNVTKETKLEQTIKTKRLPPVSVEASTKDANGKTSVKVSLGTTKLGNENHNTQFKLFYDSDGNKAGISNTTTEGKKTLKSDIYIKKK